MLQVQFVDDTEGVVLAYFATVQPIDAYPHLGEIVAEDARWATFYASMPNFVQVMLPAPAVA